MPCDCGHADECDGEYATYYPLQDGGMCTVRQCSAPKRDEPEPRRAAQHLGCPECAWGKVLGCWLCGGR